MVTRTLEWTGQKPAALLDLCGRVVAELRPGTNDLSRLGPGVYSVTVNGARSTVHARKVVLTE